jgi:hypothetical protein
MCITIDKVRPWSVTSKDPKRRRSDEFGAEKEGGLVPRVQARYLTKGKARFRCGADIFRCMKAADNGEGGGLCACVLVVMVKEHFIRLGKGWL